MNSILRPSYGGNNRDIHDEQVGFFYLMAKFDVSFLSKDRFVSSGVVVVVTHHRAVVEGPL